MIDHPLGENHWAEVTSATRGDSSHSDISQQHEVTPHTLSKSSSTEDDGPSNDWPRGGSPSSFLQRNDSDHQHAGVENEDTRNTDTVKEMDLTSPTSQAFDDTVETELMPIEIKTSTRTNSYHHAGFEQDSDQSAPATPLKAVS